MNKQEREVQLVRLYDMVNGEINEEAVRQLNRRIKGEQQAYHRLYGQYYLPKLPTLESLSDTREAEQ